MCAQHFATDRAILQNITFKKIEIAAKYQNLKLNNFETNQLLLFNDELKVFLADSSLQDEDVISIYLFKSIYEYKSKHMRNSLYNATYAYKKTNLISNATVKNNVYFLNGYLLRELHSFEKSILYLEKCAYAQNYLKYQVSFLIADCYAKLGKKEQAIDKYMELVNTSKFVSVVDYQQNLNQLIAISENNNDDALALLFSLKLDTIYSRMNQTSTKKVFISSNIYYRSITQANITNYLNTQYSVNSNNIGLLYRKLGDYKSSEKYLAQSIVLLNKNRNIEIYPDVKTNVGLTYTHLRNYTEANQNYQQAINIYIAKGNLKKQAELYNIMAKNDFLAGNFSKAIDNCNYSILIAAEEKDYANLSNSYLILSEIFSYNSDFQKSQYYYKLFNETKNLIPKNEKADQLSEVNKADDLQNDINEEIANIEKRDLQFAKIKLEATQKEQQLLLLKQQNEINEKTLLNQKLEKEQTEKSLALIKEQLEKAKLNNEYIQISKEREQGLLKNEKYQSELKQISAERKSYKLENELKEKEIIANKKIQYFLYGGLILLTAFLVFVAFALYKNNKQKHIISSNIRQLEEYSSDLMQTNSKLESTIVEVNTQKSIIEEKSNQILDSINYSSRIQNSLLVNETSLNDLFNDAFVINLPRDIVSGDFYLIKRKGDKIYVAVVDCTGHGVPGSLISIIGYQEINHILDKYNFAPSKILSMLNTNINQLINANEAIGSDGMDLMLLEIDTAYKRITYAGARGYMAVFSENVLTEYKGDKYSIGEKNNDNPPTFIDKTLRYNENDIVYLYTDGVLDQFSEVGKKRLGTKNFRDKLNGILKESLGIQKSELLNFYTSHKGNAKQTDDVTIVGLKLKSMPKTEKTVIENPKMEELLNSISKKENMRNNLIVVYGKVNQEVIIATIKLLEKKLLAENFPRTIITKAKLLSTEILQNISKHQTEHQTIHPYFIIGNNKSELNIISGNVINEKEKDFLSKTLPIYKELEIVDLKQKYLDTFSNSIITEQGNAGLGLLTIAYRSDQNIQHDIATIDEDLYHFNFEVVIKTNSVN